VAHIIAIANQKGGVGKTTTAVNLAASLAVAEQRTLLIDGDPQGNATSGVGVEVEQLTRTVYDALIGQIPLDQVILRAIQFAHLDVAPTTQDLAGAEVELIDRENRELAMREALAPLRDRYDYILIDCPPSLGLLTINMLAAADAVLIPVQCEYYALEGLSQLLNTVHRIQQSVNPGLAIYGVLLTMYDARLNLSRQVVADAREYFGPKVFETIVPRNIRLAEAPSFGKPIVLYDIASVGAQAYLSVAREIVQRDAPTSRIPHQLTANADIVNDSELIREAPIEQQVPTPTAVDERIASPPNNEPDATTAAPMTPRTPIELPPEVQ
jgi:chromosome partitioning protein